MDVLLLIGLVYFAYQFFKEGGPGYLSQRHIERARLRHALALAREYGYQITDYSTREVTNQIYMSDDDLKRAAHYAIELFHTDERFKAYVEKFDTYYNMGFSSNKEMIDTLLSLDYVDGAFVGDRSDIKMICLLELYNRILLPKQLVRLVCAVLSGRLLCDYSDLGFGSLYMDLSNLHFCPSEPIDYRGKDVVITREEGVTFVKNFGRWVQGMLRGRGQDIQLWFTYYTINRVKMEHHVSYSFLVDDSRYAVEFDDGRIRL